MFMPNPRIKRQPSRTAICNFFFISWHIEKTLKLSRHTTNFLTAHRPASQRLISPHAFPANSLNLNTPADQYSNPFLFLLPLPYSPWTYASKMGQMTYYFFFIFGGFKRWTYNHFYYMVSMSLEAVEIIVVFIHSISWPLDCSFKFNSRRFTKAGFFLSPKG